ncbi:proline-rich protein 33 [Phyllostomus hastatus]|uniref:proline-rich protein 33 n=1 Tax=Phyllostomus hastatus TaxID=9423 RepID=UPI001E6839DA|nr:proline-rich protein 33 [Phyllostomus hastatus]
MLVATASVPPSADGLCPPGPPGPPPPLLPKPGKDNLRLQRLLRRAARKKTPGAGPCAPPGAFRTSLSPVSEASHDQEPAAQRPAEAPRVVATLPHSPATHHVASPLQKSTLSFSFTQHRSPATHTTALGLRLSAPGGFAHVPAPTAGAAHASQAQLLPGPPPQAGPPELPRRGPDGGPGGQDRDTAPRPPAAQPSIPVAHIRPLPAGAQDVRPWPEAPPVPRPPPGCQASGPREVRPRVVVPIAPTYRSPGPSPPRPAPAAPEVEHLEEPPTAGPAPEAEQASGRQGASSPALPADPDARPAPSAAPRPRLSGWTRLKKQLMDEADERPPPGPEQSPTRTEQAGAAPAPPAPQPAPAPAPGPPASRACGLWDAVLYRVAVAESRRSPEGPRGGAGAWPGLGRLPYLCRPRFNARKLQEAAARPLLTTPSVVLERSPQPRNFNRTAAGWRLH